jgi:hypothetical protein
VLGHLTALPRVFASFFCGQILGAAIIARGQLERWTENLAFNIGFTHVKGESWESFVARVWDAREKCLVRFQLLGPKTAGKPVVQTMDAFQTRGPLSGAGRPGDQATPSMEFEVCPGRHAQPGEIARQLSALIHGRQYPQAIRWESCRLLQQANSDVLPAAQCITGALGLVLLQIEAVTRTLAFESGRRTLGYNLPSAWPHISSGEVVPVGPALWPVDYGLTSDPDKRMPLDSAHRTMEAVHAGQRPLGRLFENHEFAALSFAAARGRVVRAATRVFEEERLRLGALSPRSLEGRATQVVFVAESAGLLSGWVAEKYRQEAASLISSGLRSAYWLWLEDDNRAMGVLRTVLEQTARLRAWRLKPQRAERLELSPRTTAKDWLDRAGLSRLSELNTALGELAHSPHRADWGSAFFRLVRVNHTDQDGHGFFTARGNAFLEVTYLLASEILATIRDVWPTVGDAFSTLFESVSLTGDNRERTTETWLNFVHSYKGLEVPPGENVPQGWRLTRPNDNER